MSLKSFFEPASVALVGASRTKGKVGHEILTSLLAGGYEGAVYPVNPGADQIEGLPCYPDLAALPAVPDLVVIVVPSKHVLDVVRQCSQIGAKQIVVVTSGFKETGEKGLRREQDLLDVIKRPGIRMVGPNCLGLMCPPRKLNASFGGQMPDPGVIGYFSQSGSLLAAIVDKARDRGVGFSKLISIGNKADVDEMDILRTFAQDDQTRVIAGYLETFKEGDTFFREAEQISHDKPILLMKAGGTGAGARAASSHTGRLAVPRRAYESVFERAGVIRCQSITAQFDYARAFASQPLPRGLRLAIVANAGGPGIMATDAAERHGLELAALTDATVQRLRESLPAAANISNPIDVLGDALADRFELALSAALDDENVDMAVVVLTPHAMTECEVTAEAIVRVTKARPDKPLVSCFLGAQRVAKAIEVLRAGGVPNYDSPEFAVVTLQVMANYARWRTRPKRVVKLFPVNRHKVETILHRHLRLKQLEISEMEAKDVIDAYGFVTPQGMVATSADQAATFASQIGYPVVLKIWSPDIVHKAEVGGVRTALTSAQEVRDAFDLMMYRIPKKRPEAHILGVLVEQMCKQGEEVILGMTRDPHYGPLMMFGQGGVLVEKLRDVAFYLAPLTAEEAKEMLRSTRTYQMLRGDEESEGVDIDAVAEGLQRLSQLVTEFPQIQEMDINPYIVGPEGTTPIAVDARIILAES